MSRFMIVLPHTADEHLRTMDLAAESPELLAQTYWGILNGDHIGWTVVDANSEQEVREMLPIPLRSDARIAEVQKVSHEELREMHVRLA